MLHASVSHHQRCANLPLCQQAPLSSTLLPLFEILGFGLSKPTKYSFGQPQLARQLSIGQRAQFYPQNLYSCQTDLGQLIFGADY